MTGKTQAMAKVPLNPRAMVNPLAMAAQFLVVATSPDVTAYFPPRITQLITSMTLAVCGWYQPLPWRRSGYHFSVLTLSMKAHAGDIIKKISFSVSLNNTQIKWYFSYDFLQVSDDSSFVDSGSHLGGNGSSLLGNHRRRRSLHNDSSLIGKK